MVAAIGRDSDDAHLLSSYWFLLAASYNIKILLVD
jgi:hypothetical protein